MRHYYKLKNGNGILSLKEKVENKNYIEITKQEFESLRPKQPVANPNEKEMSEIEMWFARYDMLCNQYARQVRLGMETDIDIAELDAEAQIKAARLKELKLEK